MKKWQRRLWIAGVGLGTTLLIVVGLMVGAFRIAVQLVPDYQAEVEARVGELLQAETGIGRMNLIWRGRYPTLQLHEVALGDAGQDLHFEELRIGFSLWRLLQGDLMPRRVQLRGTALQLRLADGQLRLQGFSRDGASRPAPDALLDQLYEIGHIELQQASLLWLDLDHERPPRELLLEEFSARRSFRGMRIAARAQVRGQGGVEASLLLKQAPWRLEQLSLELMDLDPWADLRAYFPQAPALDGELVALSLDSRWQDGVWQSAELDFNLKDFGPADAARRFARWRGSLLLTERAPGIRAELQNLDLVAPSGRWAPNLTTAQWQADEAGVAQLELSAEYLRLDDLTPLTALLPDEQRALWRQLRPAGDVRNLVLRLDRGQDWPRVTAELEGVQLAAYEKLPGVRDFSGALSMDGDGGRLLIDSQDLILNAPQMFTDPLPLDALSGNLSWQRAADGWRISAPGLHYAAMNLDGVGRLNLTLGEAPAIDLELNFFCTDPTPWLGYTPRNWGRGIRSWLPRAVTRANVSNGQVLVQGALADFPYTKGRPGQFKVALELEDAGLKFAPDWPAVDIGRAELLIEGVSLSVAAFDNRIGGLAADQAQARIDKLHEAELTVRAPQIRGDAADIWTMLRESKLRKAIGPVLDDLDLSGRTEADLALRLPLKDLQQTDYEVTARFDRAALWTRYWPDPVQKIRGTVQIDRQGLRSHDLTASLAGIPVTAKLLPDNGLTRISAEFQAPVAQLPPSVPIGEWLRARASGESVWRFAMQVGRNADRTLRFESNLLGTTLALPRPFGKAADELRRLAVSVAPGDQTRVHVAYAQLLGFDGLVAAGQGLRAARVHFGADVLPAGAPGWWLEGQLGQAALDEWLPVIRDLAAEAGGAGQIDFGGMVLRVGELQALGQRLVDARLQLTHEAPAWRIGLASSRAQGEIRLTPAADGGRLRLDADFARLNWARDPEAEGGSADPRELPELHLRADSFRLNDVALGRLALDLTPVSRGLRIERLDVYERERKEVDISGLWLRDADGESAAVELAVDTQSFSAWLSALGYQDNIAARRGRIDGQLNWTPDPEGLSYSHLNGELDFEFSDGQLLNVEPGAGRVLGLFSINALPRRFFLDFSDVVNTGLGFDRMRGTFAISNGVADTDNFELRGPSLRIAARGEVDLARRLYDQTITIYPGLSSGVSLAATLLGGPVVGIFTLLAQELLDKPLDQVTQISYHLGGSWDNPEVSRTP